MSATRRRHLQSAQDDMYLKAYLTGYADGEGCFCVSFSRSSRHRLGWEIRPSFSVSQNDDRSQVLELFRSTLGCGTIRPDRSDRTLKYETRSVSDLATRVVPLFEQHPLRSSKQKDFEKFAEVVQLMHETKHLQADGFARIVELSREINSSGAKRFPRRAIVPRQMNA
jgi:LAGLIDADG DNA endonuclease family protein